MKRKKSAHTNISNDTNCPLYDDFQLVGVLEKSESDLSLVMYPRGTRQPVAVGRGEFDLSSIGAPPVLQTPTLSV